MSTAAEAATALGNAVYADGKYEVLCPRCTMSTFITDYEGAFTVLGGGDCQCGLYGVREAISEVIARNTAMKAEAGLQYQRAAGKANGAGQPQWKLAFTNWRDMRKQPAPKLVFAVDDLIRHPSPFLLGGDSGAGKSIFAQTWCTCMAAGLFFLGRQVRPCIAAYFTGEDDDDILHLRQERINRALGIGERDLDDRLFLCSVVDRNVWLYRDGRPTALADDLEKQLASFKAGFSIIDSASLVYADEEIHRRPVADFMRNIGAMGRRLEATLGLIAHTSRSSKADAKHMVSGSTAWVAQARAGLLLEPQDEEATCDVAVSLIAPNYTKRDQRFKLVWNDDGVLTHVPAKDIVDSIQDGADDRQLLSIIDIRFNKLDAQPFRKNSGPTLRSFMAREPLNWKAKRTATCIERLELAGWVGYRDGGSKRGWYVTEDGKKQMG